MPGIEPGAFHMQSERATTALHPLLLKLRGGELSRNWAVDVNKKCWETLAEPGLFQK